MDLYEKYKKEVNNANNCEELSDALEGFADELGAFLIKKAFITTSDSESNESIKMTKEEEATIDNIDKIFHYIIDEKVKELDCY